MAIYFCSERGLQGMRARGILPAAGWRATIAGDDDLREEMEGADYDFDAWFAGEWGEHGRDEAMCRAEIEAMFPLVDGIDGIDTISVEHLGRLDPDEDVVWVRTDAGWVRYAGV